MKITERIDRERPVFSVEFFPPKDEVGEAELWRAIRRLEPLDPAFVSVTYGAGGSSRDRTIRTTARIATETTLVPMAHLTAVVALGGRTAQRHRLRTPRSACATSSRCAATLPATRSASGSPTRRA